MAWATYWVFGKEEVFMITMRERIDALSGGNATDADAARQHFGGGLGMAFGNTGDTGLRLTARNPNERPALQTHSGLG